MNRTSSAGPRQTRARATPTRAAAVREHPQSSPASPSSVDAALDALRGQCICGNLRMAARLVTAYYDAALRPCGIEANQMMMLWVAHSGAPMPASQLAHAAGMDQSTASRNLAVLEARGLVACAVSGQDRRQRLVSLTRRGRATLARAFPRWRKAQSDLSVLTADLADLAAVGGVLRKVARRLQAA